MARFCGNCGTEVDETAVFCPTCGQPVDDGEPAEMPAAPAWPDPAAADRAADAESDVAPAGGPAGQPIERDSADMPADVPTRVEQRPPSPPDETPRPAPEEPSRPAAGGGGPASEPPPAREEGDGGGRPQIDLPITTPVTLSGWLIGIGSALAVLGLIVILVVSVINVIDLLLLLALLGVAATVFFSAQLPAVPHLRLMTLVIALIAFGVALDRIGFRGGGAGELLLFMGSAAAGIGAIILELGHDQPLGGPQR